jgi:anionic cell wall polymer biosynthesis LytR-Cps2A-Psr (LCP) family protein
MQKKAQAQIITTVLIILLVIAAVAIVWNVVNNTVSDGSKKIDQQSDCIGLIMDITNINTDTNQVTIRPSKKVAGFKVYINGQEATAEDGGPLEAQSTSTIDSTVNISAGDEIEALGKIGEEFCSGSNTKIAE